MMALEREIADDQGRRWRVYERAFRLRDGGAEWSLVFESDVAFRRVRRYPPDWRKMSDEELMALSWRT